MSLSAVSVGEHWADDGDYDEPDGDRPDERIAGSGGWQDQDRRRIDVDGTWAASGSLKRQVEPRRAVARVLLFTSHGPNELQVAGLIF
jgi:hypothetical protein